MAEARRRGPAATDIGATGRHVQSNVRRLRRARGLSTYALTDLLAEAGRPIPQSGITRIENGARRVDVDDLVALATAFDVSPSALLLPPTDDPAAKIEITGAGEIPADEAWDWADGRRRLDRPCQDPSAALLLFEAYGRPPHRRTQGRR